MVVRGQGLGVGGWRGPGEPAGPAEALNGRDVASLGQQLDADCSLAFPFGPEIRFTVGALSSHNIALLCAVLIQEERNSFYRVRFEFKAGPLFTRMKIKTLPKMPMLKWQTRPSACP